MSKVINVPVIVSEVSGAAALAMIFRYFGLDKTVEELSAEMGVKSGVYTAGDVMRCAERNGFECHAYKKNVEYLKTAEIPCIIILSPNSQDLRNVEFIVYEGYEDDSFYLNVPWYGIMKASEETMDALFTGIVMTLTQADAS